MTSILKSRQLVLGAAVLVGFGCASDASRNVEEAKFHLDKAEYTEAETKAREALAENPDDHEAKFYLASALIGLSFLSDGAGYLDLVAQVQEEAEASGSDPTMAIFITISPSAVDDAKFAQLEEATDTLLSIPDAEKNEDDYLALYASRLFEISTTQTRIGAGTADVTCQASSTSGQDGIPDGLAADALTVDQARRFNDNMDNIDSDREMAGLPDDFSLTGPVLTLSRALTDAVAAAGDVSQGTEDFFIDQFGGDPALAPCNPL